MTPREADPMRPVYCNGYRLVNGPSVNIKERRGEWFTVCHMEGPSAGKLQRVHRVYLTELLSFGGNNGTRLDAIPDHTDESLEQDFTDAIGKLYEREPSNG